MAPCTHCRVTWDSYEESGCIIRTFLASSGRTRLIYAQPLFRWGEIEFFIDNLLVRIHYIIMMVRWTGPVHALQGGARLASGVRRSLSGSRDSSAGLGRKVSGFDEDDCAWDRAWGAGLRV